MKNNAKKVIWLVIGIIIGASTIVGATTIFRSEDITYSSDKTTKTNVKDSLNELYNLTSNYEFYKPLADQVELGDYISMTPTKTSYVIPAEVTGYESSQEINPSQLNLWRVIKKNDNGTVEVISEYVSNENVYFYGQAGYMNLVGALNQIASQYTNNNYVESTRYFGYSNQIETCKSIDNCPVDTGYRNDVELVNTALGTLNTSTPNGSFGQYYFVSGRSHKFDENNNKYALNTICVFDDGKEHFGDVANPCGWLVYSGGGEVLDPGKKIRPILTLKSLISISNGDGKSAETAYTFE